MQEVFSLDLCTHHVLRFDALLLHFIMTTVLIWTKFDSIQSSIYYTDNSTFSDRNQSYLGMVYTALILLLIRIALLAFEKSNITFTGVMSLFLDCLACFFIGWIALDGLIWSSYAYVFGFCV